MKSKINLLLIFIGLILTNCTENIPSNEEDIWQGIKELKGNIQKGPFISGSTVMVQLLNENFNPTGVIYSTTTNNDFGGFIIESEINAPYVEIITDGFYFDEVNGYISDSRLTLRSLAKINHESIQETNVNVLTTLSKERIIHLVKNEGLSYEEAKKQAQNEILAIFEIPGNDTIDFNQATISEDGEENAILLAISCILQGYHKTNALSELISRIILEIKEDGILHNREIQILLRSNASYINLQGIRSNLEARYNSISHNFTIPPFEKYAKYLTTLRLISTIPGEDRDFASGIDKMIYMYFNKALDQSTITPENVVIKNSSGQILKGQLSYDTYINGIYFTPTEEMLNGETYTVYVTGIKAYNLEEYETTSYTFKTYPLEFEKGLKAYYTFSGNTNDMTGNNAHAKAYNGRYLSVSTLTGTENQAYHLQGRGSYIEIPNVIDISKPNWSYSIWINFLSLDPDVHSLLFGLSSSCDMWGKIPLSIQNENRTIGGDKRIVVIVDERGQSAAYVKGDLIDTWNLFTITVENNQCQIYQNGELILEPYNSIEFLFYSQPYYISQSPEMEIEGGPLVYLDALIDNVRLYDRALNKKEVMELYQTKK